MSTIRRRTNSHLEVASGWVKYIRDHVREGQKIVCKVLNVDPSRSHIDSHSRTLMSIRDAQNSGMESEQKAEKWLEFVADATGWTKMRSMINSLTNLTVFTMSLRTQPCEARSSQGIQTEVAAQIALVAKENVKIPYVYITGYVDLTCPQPNGIDVIKRALKAAMKSKMMTFALT